MQENNKLKKMSLNFYDKYSDKLPDYDVVTLNREGISNLYNLIKEAPDKFKNIIEKLTDFRELEKFYSGDILIEYSKDILELLKEIKFFLEAEIGSKSKGEDITQLARAIRQKEKEIDGLKRDIEDFIAKQKETFFSGIDKKKSDLIKENKNLSKAWSAELLLDQVKKFGQKINASFSEPMDELYSVSNEFLKEKSKDLIFDFRMLEVKKPIFFDTNKYIKDIQKNVERYEGYMGWKTKQIHKQLENIICENDGPEDEKFAEQVFAQYKKDLNRTAETIIAKKESEKKELKKKYQAEKLSQDNECEDEGMRIIEKYIKKANQYLENLM